MNKSIAPLCVHTLILGGGLSGLSTAYHLEKAGKTDYLLVEKNPHFGGLCTSEERDGFTFDVSGHLLHLHDPYATALVKKLLRGNLARLKRRAFINFNGRQVPFPFQANLWALPKNVRQECLQGALDAAKVRHAKPKNFEQWCLSVFGEGIYKHFMCPYNQKLWQTHPRNMTWDWCGAFVPKPDTKLITAGAQKPPKTLLGYNSYFYYPLRGGCGALAQALAAHIPNTWLSAEVQHIDLKRKEAAINGRTVRFERLINTLPLKDFVRLTNAPQSMQNAAKKLKNTTVHVFNFAVKRTAPNFDWMYFPQGDVPFYRVGVQSRFSPHNAPAGHCSFYVETAEKITDFKATQKAILKALAQKGIIDKQDKILCPFWQTIPTAYAVYDVPREANVSRVLRWLNKRNCLCVGRYGLWEYSFMERSLLQGRDAAEKLA